MSLLERLVASLTALITLAAGVLGLALVSGWNGTPWLFDLVAAARGPARLEIGLVALLLVGLALFLLVQVWQREPAPPRLRQTTQLGDISISLRAVESLVYRAARQVKGIAEVDVQVAAAGEELAIDLSLLVAPDLRVPDVTRAVQERVEAYVRETVGVPVSRIGVEVRNIARESRARVE
ncbi:MAG TPA: alkaline shock response membrane anchor protein AmaP [Limnochordales bacterium]